MSWFLPISICDMMEHMKELVLKIQSCRIFMTEGNSRISKRSPGHGTCDCGKCKCDVGWSGEACQYPIKCDLTQKISKQMCKNSQDVICSNAGTCHCGRCKCDNSDGNGLIYGKFCECDDRECIDDETEEAMGSVTVETVTARLVGMEINANSSVTSPPGKASEDAHLQMAKSAATEEHVFVVNVLATMLIPLGTGEISMGTRASAMRGTVELCMIDTLMISVQTNPMAAQAQTQGFDVVCPNIHHFYDLLEHLKGPTDQKLQDLQNTGHLLSVQEES
ncbi:integrin beta-like 1 [Cricetulus griseus]